MISRERQDIQIKYDKGTCNLRIYFIPKRITHSHKQINILLDFKWNIFWKHHIVFEISESLIDGKYLISASKSSILIINNISIKNIKFPYAPSSCSKGEEFFGS